MNKYTAAVGISHNGTDYAAGTVVELDDADAARLVGIVKLVGADDNAVDLDQIVDAIWQIIDIDGDAIGGGEDAQDAAHWTRGGKPQVAALEDILLCSISAKQRDDAWAICQANQPADAE